MSRKRYVYDGAGNAVEITADGYAQMHYIQPEIRPFRSMADGSIIESRKKYEDHLKRHGMRQVDPSEVQTEKIMSYRPNYDVKPEQRKELIRAQVDAMPEREFRKALQRDIDNIKWNSNFK